MIVSLNLRTDTGTPGWVDLEPPAKKVYFKTKTLEQRESYLGNIAIEDLPKGYAVNKNALKKQEWQFAKRLYLTVSSFMIQSVNGDQYHHLVPTDQMMVFSGVSYNGELYSYMVVERSTDPKYRYWPVYVNME